MLLVLAQLRVGLIEQCTVLHVCMYVYSSTRNSSPTVQIRLQCGNNETTPQPKTPYTMRWYAEISSLGSATQSCCALNSGCMLHLSTLPTPAQNTLQLDPVPFVV